MDKETVMGIIKNRTSHWAGTTEVINELAVKILNEMYRLTDEENATAESIRHGIDNAAVYFSCIFDLCEFMARDIEFNTFRDQLEDMIVVPKRAVQKKTTKESENA